MLIESHSPLYAMSKELEKVEFCVGKLVKSLGLYVHSIFIPGVVMTKLLQATLLRFVHRFTQTKTKVEHYEECWNHCSAAFIPTYIRVNLSCDF